VHFLCGKNILEEIHTYSYDKVKQSYSRHEVDVIVGSFSNHNPMTESEMLDVISQQALSDLRESGFEV
jgi:hypothetical protein